MSAPRPSASCALTLHLCKVLHFDPSSTANHHPARSVWDEHPFPLPLLRQGPDHPTSPHLYGNVANLCTSSASIDLHERLQHSDQPSFFDASKLPFLKLIDDEVERHLRPKQHSLCSIGLCDHFSLSWRALPHIAIPPDTSATLSSNAILNLSCRRIPSTRPYTFCSGTATTDA